MPARSLSLSPPRTLPGSAPPWLSRGDLGLKEDEDENQEGRQDGGKHHPDGERRIQAQRVDDPAPDRGVGHREAFRHTEFLWEGDAGENNGGRGLGAGRQGQPGSWALGNLLMVCTQSLH